jgi:hypothetical protein
MARLARVVVPGLPHHVTQRVNGRGRFGCVVMDGAHHMAAVRYVLMNPVRAKLCEKPEA